MNSSVAVVVVVVGGSPLAPSINETRDLYRSHGTNGVCRVKVARRVTNEVAYFCVSRTGSASVFSHCSSRLPTQRQHAMWYVCVCGTANTQATDERSICRSAFLADNDDGNINK